MPAQFARERFEIPKVLIAWTAPTRRFEAKNKLWFFGLAVITIAIFVLLVLVNEALLGVLMVSLAFLLFVVSAVRPPLVMHSIHTTGVEIGQKMYLWDDLESFFIDDEEELLILKTNLSFPSELTLHLEQGKEGEIEDLLLEKLPFIEVRRTDYLAMVDGFIAKFVEKLPVKLTKKIVKKPDDELTVEPSINKLSAKIKGLRFKTKAK